MIFMEIKIFNTAAQAAEFTANLIIETVQTVEKPNLGVATGRTMDAVYHNLVTRALNDGVDFSNVRAFAVDEYVGLAKGSANSYRSYLDMHLFNQLNFSPNNIFIPNVYANDIDEACYEYEQNIKSYGGVDLQLLGIGRNGHIGLNEPGSSLDSHTRIVALTSSTRSSNKVLFHDESMPLTAVTMGIGTILSSKKCLLLATGETKSEIIQKMVNGDINSKIPATALKEHKNSLLILDQEAAKLI